MNPAALGEQIPATCLVSDVLKHLRISRRTFDRLMARRELALVELKPIGRLRRFSGESVKAALQTRWGRTAAA